MELNTGSARRSSVSLLTFYLRTGDFLGKCRNNLKYERCKIRVKTNNVNIQSGSFSNIHHDFQSVTALYGWEAS